MIFSTKYSRTPTLPEANCGEKLVETAGYVPAKKRIEDMILAGQRLVDYRKSLYDFPDGEIDENASDPTRDLNFDMADATQLQMSLEASLKASQTAQEGSGEVLTPPPGYKLVKDEIAPEGA